MKKIIISIPNINKQYYYDNPIEFKLKTGDKVIIENAQILEFAEVIGKTEEKTSAELEMGLGAILRKATKEDQEKLSETKQKALAYLPICREIVENYHLPMKLVDADLSFDEKKLTFYFGAEGRVDFRQLVTDLIKKFKKLIRLQQIGARDEAKIIGGFGKCGRKLCCQSFLKKVDSVTLDVAKEQNLSTGVSKISGACGKLMCCLSYELEQYRKLKEILPEIGSEIKIKQGKGRVIDQQILKTAVTVELENGEKVKVKI